MFARARSFGRFDAWAERVVLVLLPLTIFGFAMGSSSVAWAMQHGHSLRWVLLFALAVAAVPYGLAGVAALPRWFVALLGSLVALALLSSLWSVTPRVTAERAVSFAVMLSGLVLLGAGAVRSLQRIERLLAATLAGAVLVALAGLVVLAVDHQLAVQAAWSQMPNRLRGFGENPNTASMLFGLTLPIACWFAVSRRRLPVRLGAIAAFVLLYGSTMASGSRGAMLASAGSVIVLVAMIVRSLGSWRPVLAISVAVAFFATSYEVSSQRPSLAPPPTVVAAPAQPHLNTPATTVTAESGGTTTKPKPPTTTTTATTATTTTAPPAPAGAGAFFGVAMRPGIARPDVSVPFVPREDEVGFPSLYVYKPILGWGSGRVFAWLSAIRQGLACPVFGYGFGTEQAVFVDRFYFFQGAFTENSFVGMFLQLGLVGLLLMVVPAVLALVLVGRRAWSTRRFEPAVAVPAAVVLAGLIVGCFESYMYSVGNLSTLTFWAGVVMTVAAASRPVPA